MDERLSAAWQLLPEYLSQHILLSAAALVLGLAISLPLMLLALRNARARWFVLTIAGVIQTIPALALLALFYPLLLALSVLSQHVFGMSFSALGFLPSLLALALYAMLPIIRNGTTGVLNLDPAIIEAARGVGMTERERLWRVDLPLAVPMLMAGIRTAAVWVIGAAALSTPVGQTSLGNYIFSGLQLENWIAVLFGCISAALTAIVTDQLLALIESGVRRRVGQRIVAGVGALLIGICAAAAVHFGGGSSGYVIGAKSFSEQYVLAELLQQRIEREGASAARRVGLGSAIAFRALVNDEIDVYVDYSGTVWANFMGRSDAVPRNVMLDEIRQWLEREHAAGLLGALGFENAYALAMRRNRAAELGIRSVADLARHAATLRIGGDFEFFERPEWRALRDAYGLAFATTRQYQSTFMYRAAASGEVDVIAAFSSDGRIAADDLLVLEDPLQAIPPYDAIVLIAPKRRDDVVLRRALQPLVGSISAELMREANLMVDRDADKRTPAEAADWLAVQLGK